VKTESNIKLRFTQSPSGIISGVAFEEDGHILASFKLKAEGSSDYTNDKSWSSLMLTMISGTLGAKVYDAFDGILSKYIEEVKKTLEKRKTNFLARAANNQTTRVSPVERDSRLNK